MGHDGWSQLTIGGLQLVLGVVVSVCGWIVLRAVSRYEAQTKSCEKHGREIRDTRQAISRIEGKLDITPFPYQE